MGWQKIMRFSILAAMVWMMFLAGCGGSQGGFGGNTLLLKGDTILEKHQPRDRDYAWMSVIKNRGGAFVPVILPQVCIESGDGSRVFLPDMTVGELIEIAEPTSKLNISDFPGGSAELSLDEKYFFIVKGDYVLMFFTRAPLWDKTGSHRFEFPISYEKAVELLGTPDMVL